MTDRFKCPDCKREVVIPPRELAPGVIEPVTPMCTNHIRPLHMLRVHT